MKGVNLCKESSKCIQDCFLLQRQFSLSLEDDVIITIIVEVKIISIIITITYLLI